MYHGAVCEFDPTHTSVVDGISSFCIHFIMVWGCEFMCSRNFCSVVVDEFLVSPVDAVIPFFCLTNSRVPDVPFLDTWMDFTVKIRMTYPNFWICIDLCV